MKSSNHFQVMVIHWKQFGITHILTCMKPVNNSVPQAWSLSATTITWSSKSAKSMKHCSGYNVMQILHLCNIIIFQCIPDCSLTCVDGSRIRDKWPLLFVQFVFNGTLMQKHRLKSKVNLYKCTIMQHYQKHTSIISLMIGVHLESWYVLSVRSFRSGSVFPAFRP